MDLGNNTESYDGSSKAADSLATKVLPLRIASSRPFNFSAQPFTTEDLHFATHNTDLEYFPRSFNCLNLDAYIMGLGGDDSWSASVHEDYLIQPDVYSFDWKLSFLF
jgi:hypothetical protein